MSVASLAGYLTNVGQSTYNKFTIATNTGLKAVETETVLFGNGDIILPAGTYLVTTFIFLQAYDAEGDEAGTIDTAQVTVGYLPAGGDLKVINNQIYTGTGTPQDFIQTSGIFVSDGTGSLVVIANVLTATDATQYNVMVAPNLSPQVQIVKIA